MEFLNCWLKTSRVDAFIRKLTHRRNCCWRYSWRRDELNCRGEHYGMLLRWLNAILLVERYSVGWTLFCRLNLRPVLMLDLKVNACTSFWTHRENSCWRYSVALPLRTPLNVIVLVKPARVVQCWCLIWKENWGIYEFPKLLFTIYKTLDNILDNLRKPWGQLLAILRSWIFEPLSIYRCGR